MDPDAADAAGTTGPDASNDDDHEFTAAFTGSSKRRQCVSDHECMHCHNSVPRPKRFEFESEDGTQTVKLRACTWECMIALGPHLFRPGTEAFPVYRQAIIELAGRLVFPTPTPGMLACEATHQEYIEMARSRLGDEDLALAAREDAEAGLAYAMPIEHERVVRTRTK